MENDLQSKIVQPFPLSITDGPIPQEWAENARLTLAGASPVRVRWELMNDDEVHHTLMAHCERMNQNTPVSARFQSRPDGVSALLGEASETTKTARGGSAYNWGSRPHQYYRPVSLHLKSDAESAVMAEVERLETVCGAIELAPPHDFDKALPISAAAWERTPLRLGPWPKETPITLLPSGDVPAYDRHHLRMMRIRRLQGKPYRDVESPVFTVPKADGGYRLVTDYRRLNKFQRKTPFKMEGVQSVAEIIMPGDYGMLVDLKDAYLTMGLHPSHRKYCRFIDPRGRRMQWKTVSFGVAEAPRICTKLLKPLIGVLKSLGIRTLIYIDDVLIVDQDRTRLCRAMALAMDLLQGQVGLQLKVSKCCFRPAQTFKCLGLIWNTKDMRVSVPNKRLKEMQKTASRLLRSTAGPNGTQRIPTRDLARLVGRITATTRAIRGARRRLLFLQQGLGHAVRSGGWNGSVLLSPEGLQALRWWTTEEPWKRNASPIVNEVREIQVKVKSDAATETLGWGGTLQQGRGREFTARGYFTESERKLHINGLELLGCWYTIRALLGKAVPKENWHRVHLSCQLDSMVAIKYCRVAVSRSLTLSRLGAQMYDWMEAHHLQASYRHLAGILNVEADRLSREAWSHIEWKLLPQLFDEVGRVLQLRVEYDLFASRQNRQVQKFFSWSHDFESMGCDSLSHPWSMTSTLYAYPPPILLGRVLQKAHQEEVHDLLLVAPVWTTQIWWPMLLHLLVDVPLLLPNREWTVEDPGGAPAWPCRWNLCVFRLSGNTQRRTVFRARLWRECGHPTRRVIQRRMTRISNDSRNSFKNINAPLSMMVDSVLDQFTQIR